MRKTGGSTSMPKNSSPMDHRNAPEVNTPRIGRSAAAPCVSAGGIVPEPNGGRATLLVSGRSADERALHPRKNTGTTHINWSVR